MSINRYLLIMAFGTLISAVSWTLVLLYLEPSSGTIGVTLFLASFFLTIFGVASVVGYVVRRIFVRGETPFRAVAVSFRHAILLGALLTGSLWLQSKQLFNLWTGVLLVAFLSLIEAFMVTRAVSQPAHRGGASAR